MKNLFLSFAVIASVLAVSCKKDNDTKPNDCATPNTPAPVSINVEYKIVSESGNVEVAYLFPNADGKLEMKSETIARTDYSVSFTAKKGNLLSVEAWNVMPARKLVNVQILVNGEIFQEASSNSPSDKAIASGNF
jgi:hypothetical protein